MKTRWMTYLTRFGAFAGAIALVVGAYLVLGPQALRSGTDPAAADTTDAQGQKKLQPAPDFTLPALQGGTFRLSAHRGQVIVLNFWATWCAPCRKEIPDFIKLQSELGHRGVLFVGISLDQGGFEVVRPYAEQMGINYPILHDDGTVAEKFGGIPGLPTTFLIGPEGKVHAYAPGMVTEDLLRPKIEELLALRDEA